MRVVCCYNAGVAKSALCMSRILKNPSYKEPQHKI